MNLLNSEITSGAVPALRVSACDIASDDVVVLEGITLDNEQDASTLLSLISKIEKGEDVSVSDFSAISQPVVAPKTRLKMSELFQKFYDERKSEWTSNKTHCTNLAIYDCFIEINGDIFADQLGTEHANHYIDVLRKLPPNRKKLKQFKHKSIDELLAIEGSFTPMSIQNVNKYIERIADAFRWLKQRKRIAENVLDGMKIKDKNKRKRANELRKRFSDHDISQIFSSTQYLHGTHDRTFKHWLPLLGIYTGARLGELSQLRINDVYKHKSIWVIDINDEEDKKVKNVYSHRQIPVHKTLIKLGFIKYIEHLKLCYERELLLSTHLFPDVVIGRDGYGHNTSKRFITYLTQLGLKSEGLAFHSFRHTFADIMKQDMANPVITAELLGHEIDNETLGRYAKNYAISTMKKAIDKYSPLSVAQIQKIKPFRLWIEFEPKDSLQRFDIIDPQRSINSDKNLVRALAGRIDIKQSIPINILCRTPPHITTNNDH